MEEVKWYQQGWFKIVTIIIGAVLAWFTGGQSLVAVLKYLAVVAVMYVVMSLVENPILKAILQIVAMVVLGYIDTGSLTFSPMMLVEAAGIVVQTKIAMDLIALQEEMREFRKMVNEKEKEMEKMKKEVGMDDYNADWMLYIASLAPVENPEDFYDRALNTSHNDLSLDSMVDVSVKLPTPQGD